MDLAQLYKNHDQQKENYNNLRDKTWQEMKQRHENLIAAFQSKENLPDGYSQQIDKEVDAFNSEWSIPNGTKYKDMILQHEEQIKAVTQDLEPANDQQKPIQYKGFMDNLASSKILEEEAEQDKDISVGKRFTKNKDDMDLEID